MSAPEEFQINQIRDILRDKMTSRKIDSRALQPGLIEGAGKVKKAKNRAEPGNKPRHLKEDHQIDQRIKA